MATRLTTAAKVLIAIPLLMGLGAILAHSFPEQTQKVSQLVPAMTSRSQAPSQQTSVAPAAPATTGAADAAGSSAIAAAADQLARLQQALDRKDWKAADKATYEALLRAAGPKSTLRGYTTMDEGKTFDCMAIKQVDQMWIKASGGRFGFTPQVAVQDINKNNWKKAYHQLGWASDDKGTPAITFRYDIPSRRYVYVKQPDWAHLKDGELPTVERNYNLEYSFDGTLARCGIR